MRALAAVLLGTIVLVSHADVYLEPDAFVAQAFGGDPPAPQALWLDGATRDALEHVLGHPPATLRVRYWARDGRSVWVLEEIGKEEPITTGVVIEGGAIAEIRVLIYRESRGWEVRYPFFTDQFRSLQLTPELRLTRHIDGITGATLSVRALTRIARAALLLDRATAHG